MSAFKHSLTVNVPFASPYHASIALQVLEVDPELQPHSVKRILEVDDNVLIANFNCSTVRLTRLTVNAYLENVDLVLKTLSAFGEDA
ncbi:transcription factor Pcc1, partial [Schizopora paradoxa]